MKFNFHRIRMFRSYGFMFVLLFPVTFLISQPRVDNAGVPVGGAALTIENPQVKLTVRVSANRLSSDRLEVQPNWASNTGGRVAFLETDADFAIDLMYTDWDAPGKANNADNLITLTKADFSVQRQDKRVLPDGTNEITLFFGGVGHNIQLMMSYRLDPKSFFVKRSLSLIDTVGGGHFIRFIWPRAGQVSGVAKIVKDGGFGQPVAVLLKDGGAFFGDEYPASDNSIKKGSKEKYLVRCGAEVGERLGKSWLQSDWVVSGITPDPYVKLWFDKYVNTIRVAPLRSFSLYNTWYDLRSPEYPRWSKDNVMSIETSLKMVDILRKNMMEKHHIQLDAFVLDDGWDVYKSDWVLRKEQWPNGLKPLADELKKTNTSLGVWIGPTGGYSFHSLRYNWMKEHGYETVGDMMCVAGKNYSALLRQRVGDFVQNDDVGYFKWDGIQFSCSEPNHGHPVDVYSRRAVFNSVASMAKTARERNPAMFLNITSGTWMSPWWVKVANTIWMQGADYGFADVPSISSRDGSITYRDFVLYEDWKLKGLWFPISNLMTHGIIKGKNFSVGNPAEPLDKFTDDVLLYFARGVAMYELYISPDILSDGEWTSISRSMAWARKNFDVLMHTELVGGNPMKGETYAYVHFAGNKGIIAARNPVIEPSNVEVSLSAAQGLDPKAGSLVLQRLYPNRWTSPKLYKAGEKVILPLEGFETAIYELFPLSDATEPLIAGAAYDVLDQTKSAVKLSVHSVTPQVKILNPELVKKGSGGWESVRSLVSGLSGKRAAEPVNHVRMDGAGSGKGSVNLSLTVADGTTDAMVAVLLTQEGSSKAKTPLNVTASIDGNAAAVSTEHQEGKSQWYKIAVTPGEHTLQLRVATSKDTLSWQGKASFWFVARQKQETRTIELALNRAPVERSLPPVVWPAGEVRKNIKMGELKISASQPR